MHSEAAELYKATRKESLQLSIAFLKLLPESLVTLKMFDKTLDLFEEIIESGFKPSKFVYGKAVQA